ncbi:Gfo/Idh/MocA family protein [Myceligenerans pegani]|uniref:Gfo/Idh/MocA family oxidoreductase n=1 Tax=Myceligenerans pegani TaxID=2776917 RepID=A0ABR9N5W6_9MICO|nr:Gfo/Idh/MocA family oxidoreductase [Myceligenerans sp. TRM 65318]MBE1878755.1 Gfo/Idh/MocA family oxidoreductase [Myceligenerans sp. TRM 65318]MBE3021026.1 Gfo/Idh/MocA family oxidoreductase [Myceligenerans sp. TRM 65318]
MRTTILGTGAIAGQHARAIRELAAHGITAQVTHAVDIDADRAARFAAEHDVPRHGTSLAEALPETDVLHVCTPPGAHLDATLAALAAGVHVIVEKPAVLSLAELDRIAVAERSAAPARSGPGTARFTQVVQHRFGAGALRLRRLLDDGALGRPLVATCDTLWFRPPAYFDVPWRGRWDTEGGGPTMGHGIHQFDLLLAIFGPWTEVTAMAGRLAREVDTEDVSMAIVRFANGAMASVTNSLLSPRETSGLRFDTERATVELSHLYGYSDENWTFTPARGQDEAARLWIPEPDALPSGHTAQFVPTYQAFATGETPPVTVDDARGTLELAAAIYRSAFTGAPVRAGQIGPDDPFHESMRGTGPEWAPVKDVPAGIEEVVR